MLLLIRDVPFNSYMLLLKFVHVPLNSYQFSSTRLCSLRFITASFRFVHVPFGRSLCFTTILDITFSHSAAPNQGHHPRPFLFLLSTLIN